LDEGVHVIAEMVPIMYAETDKSLYGAAGSSVFAAMQRLVSIGTVRCSEPTPSKMSAFHLTKTAAN
jgi:hypothetical protein